MTGGDPPRRFAQTPANPVASNGVAKLSGDRETDANGWIIVASLAADQQKPPRALAFFASEREEICAFFQRDDARADGRCPVNAAQSG